MKKILMTLAVMAMTALSAFGQTNWAKTVMYDSVTGRFLDSNIIPANQIATLNTTNQSWAGTNAFQAITLGGVTRTNWPSGGGAWGTITGTLSSQTDLWTELTNRYTKAEVDGKGYLTAIPSYYVTNGMSGVNFASLTVGGNAVLTTIPSYYLTNGQDRATLGSIGYGVFSNATTTPVPMYLGSYKIWDWGWNAVFPKVPVLANDGSVTAPAYAFDLDNSLGMYRYGSGVLGFSALGTNTFRVTSDGATVIGSLTLGGVGRTNWPTGGDVYLANNNIFTGSNTFTSVLIATNDGRMVMGRNLDMTNIWDGVAYGTKAYGAVQRGLADATCIFSIGTGAIGAEQSGYNQSVPLFDGIWYIGSNCMGAAQSGRSGASTGSRMVIDGLAVGAMQRGYLRGSVGGGSFATNMGVGAIQLFDLTNSQSAYTTTNGDGSILLGAGIASNRYAIVAGDLQVSHGDGSISAAGGFWDNGTRLTAGGDVYLANNNVFTKTNTMNQFIGNSMVLGTGLSLTNIGTMAYGSLQMGTGPMTIGALSYGSEQAGWVTASGANMDIETMTYGCKQQGYVGSGSMKIRGAGQADTQIVALDGGSVEISPASIFGASQFGYVKNSYATNSAHGSFQLLYLTNGQVAVTTSGGNGSLLMGSGTASNEHALVVGDSQVSHGNGSVSASGGFWDNGTRLVNGGGGGVSFPDGSYMTNVWVGSTNTLYIVDPTRAYTNKIGQFGP